MDQQTAAPKAPISDSTFQMLRCVITVAHADHVVKESERAFLRTLVAHVERGLVLAPPHLARLEEDLRVPQDIDTLLPLVTDRSDREQLVLFAGLLAQADGEMHPNEEAILRKIKAHEAAGGSAGALATQPLFSAPAPLSGGELVPNAQGHSIAHPGNFADEVRDIIRQEVYRQQLMTSGVTRGMRPAPVVDAFAEQSLIVPISDARDVLQEMPKMSYAIKRSLVPGERLAGQARFHWVYVLDAVLLTLAMWFVAPYAGHAGLRLAQFCLDSPQLLQLAGAHQTQLVRFLMSRWPLLGPGLLCYILAIGYLTWKILVWKTTEILVTDRRILIKQGILSINRHKLELNDIGETTVHQSLLGKILDYGSIDAFTVYAGRGKGGQLILPPIADPHGFTTLIDRAQRMWFMGQGGNVANVRPSRQ